MRSAVISATAFTPPVAIGAGGKQASEVWAAALGTLLMIVAVIAAVDRKKLRRCIKVRSRKKRKKSVYRGAINANAVASGFCKDTCIPVESGWGLVGMPAALG